MEKVSAEAYFKRPTEQYDYLDIFFALCRKYGINYASASEKDKAFIAEAAKAAYEAKKQ